jgi:hypothetical protein
MVILLFSVVCDPRGCPGPHLAHRERISIDTLYNLGRCRTSESELRKDCAGQLRPAQPRLAGSSQWLVRRPKLRGALVPTLVIVETMEASTTRGPVRCGLGAPSPHSEPLSRAYAASPCRVMRTKCVSARKIVPLLADLQTAFGEVLPTVPLAFLTGVSEFRPANHSLIVRLLERPLDW